MAKRRSNGEGWGPFKVADGRWKAELVIGWTSQGKPLKKIVYGATRIECQKKLRDIIRAREDGTLVLGKSPTVSAWMHHWLEEIVAPSRAQQTTQGYRSKISQYVDPAPIAGVRLNALTPEHLDQVYSAMRAKKLSPATILQTHRIISRALKVAVQRGRLGSNPADRMDPPTAPPPDAEIDAPISLDEARRLVAAAEALPDGSGAGWLINLALGLRQAERLAIGWDCLDLDAGELRIRRTLQSVHHQHGCPADAPCGRRAHLCPQRHGGGLTFGKPKSSSGRRSIALPAQLVKSLKAHQRAQEARRAMLGGWEPYTDPQGVSVDLVFCQDNGRPIGPRTDWGRWKAFLEAQGVAHARVHDGRHTAATVLLLMGVDPRVVMEIMGWSQVSMLKRYQHVIDDLKKSAAEAVGSALFGAPVSEPPVPGNVVSVDFARRKKA